MSAEGPEKSQAFFSSFPFLPPSFLPSFFPSFLPSFLPSFFPFFLPSFPPSYLAWIYSQEQNDHAFMTTLLGDLLSLLALLFTFPNRFGDEFG
jgi:hypothetical protein